MIASTARAGVNVRVMVGDTVAGVLDHVRKAIDDKRVRVDVVEANEPSPVSPYDDEAFRLLEATIAEVFPDAVPSPYVMMAATDSRFFTAICDRVYRYAPFRMTKAQRESIHSYDEHIGVDDFARRHRLVPAPDREDHLMAGLDELDRRMPTPAQGLAAIVGFLVCVELASGVLQGYYTPIFSDIADHLSIPTPTSTGSRPRS